MVLVISPVYTILSLVSAFVFIVYLRRLNPRKLIISLRIMQHIVNNLVNKLYAAHKNFDV
jgi:hypothetical protein